MDMESIVSVVLCCDYKMKSRKLRMSLLDMAGPHLIKFGIESKFSCEKTSTQRFKHNIVQVLRDMRAVCEAVGGVGASRAKL